eukprot:661981-Alexandrium_andersonii.AAC.1
MCMYRPRLKGQQQKGSSASGAFPAPAQGAAAPRTPRCSPGGANTPPGHPEKRLQRRALEMLFGVVRGG